MNRSLIYAIAVFSAVVGVSLVGADNTAQAGGRRCHGCAGWDCGGGYGCHGGYACHGCYGGTTSGYRGYGGAAGDEFEGAPPPAPAPDAPAAPPAPPAADTGEPQASAAPAPAVVRTSAPRRVMYYPRRIRLLR